jgi:soluble lytic murein transglycosylase
MPIHSKLVVSLSLSLLALTSASASADEDARQAFVAAMQRVRLNQADLPDSAALEGYAIHDYLVAARLRRDLTKRPGEALDSDIDTFLQAHAGEPVTHGLRHDWLTSLAERRRWGWFLPRSADVSDPALICDQLAGRLAMGDTDGLGAAVLARWMLPQKTLPECSEIFGWLRRQNLVTPELAEIKARAALAADNPRLGRELAADVPIARAAALLQWSDLLEAPKTALTVLASHPNLTVDPDALAAGFEKLTRTDVGTSLYLLPLLRSQRNLTPAIQSRLQRAAALGAAYDRDPRAIATFDALDGEAADPQVAEWRVRAALWSGDFAKALAWIEQMPAGLAAQPRWRYWRARAVAATLGTDAAPLFAEIADMRDYYGYLAADRLHRGYNLNARPSPDDLQEQAAIAARPGLIRARELFACEMTEEAGVEWTAVVGGAEPRVKIQAAHLAMRWGWYAQSIATLAQAGEWDDVRLRYPRPYPDAVADAAEMARLPADWILAVMRQESLFRKDAVSRADARGIMQMLPATAAAVARRWHLPPLHKDDLFDPAVAIPLGAAYLRELLDRYGGRLELTLAAYNAGTGPVARWMPRKPIDADIWVENIPYAETRSYVQHILEHIVAFSYVRGADPPRLEELAPAIEPAAPVL